MTIEKCLILPSSRDIDSLLWFVRNVVILLQLALHNLIAVWFSGLWDWVFDYETTAAE